MVFTTAEKVLIVGGMLNLAYGALLGLPIIVTRAKGAPTAPRYLMTAHVGTLPHAAVLLGLVWGASHWGRRQCAEASTPTPLMVSTLVMASSSYGARAIREAART